MDRFLEPALTRLSQRVVKLAGQQGFGFFGLRDRLFHAIKQRVDIGLLFGQVLFEVAALGSFPERTGCGVVERFQLAGDRLFLFGEFPGVFPHLFHGIRETLHGRLAKRLPQISELSFGAGRRGRGLGDLSFLEGFGRLPQILTVLFQLLLRLGHAGKVFRLLHTVAEFVRVAEDFLLVVA